MESSGFATYAFNRFDDYLLPSAKPQVSALRALLDYDSGLRTVSRLLLLVANFLLPFSIRAANLI